MQPNSSIRKIHGRRAILEALRSKSTKVEKILLARGIHGATLQELKNIAEAHSVPVEWLDRHRLDKLAGPVVHQGAMAILRGHKYVDMADLLAEIKLADKSALLVVCDEIEDPRNLGAIIRCAEGAGAQGMIITAHRSAQVTPTSDKTSGGAVTHLPIAQVVNLANTLRELKAAGVWIVGLDAIAGQSLWQSDLKRSLALVVGNEGKGLRRLTKESCDMLVKIPMQGQVDSLNAAVAAGVALFEVVRQQQTRMSFT